MTSLKCNNEDIKAEQDLNIIQAKFNECIEKNDIKSAKNILDNNQEFRKTIINTFQSQNYSSKVINSIFNLTLYKLYENECIYNNITEKHNIIDNYQQMIDLFIQNDYKVKDREEKFLSDILSNKLECVIGKNANEDNYNTHQSYIIFKIKNMLNERNLPIPIIDSKDRYDVMDVDKDDIDQQELVKRYPDIVKEAKEYVNNNIKKLLNIIKENVADNTKKYKSF